MRNTPSGRRVRSVSKGVLFTAVAFAALSVPAAGQEPDRGGFTLLLSLGVGIQNDVAGSETGLAGLNLGIGGFLTDQLALMFRASGTNVNQPFGRQVSGVGGPAVQYWVNDNFFVEGGAGVGFWDVEGLNDNGLGLILGAGYSFFNSGKHSLHIGVEYAPALTDPETVHNFGLVFGWQLL